MDFKNRAIEIRASTDNWGPYPFDFNDALPSEDDISAVTVSAFTGKVLPEDATLDESGDTVFLGQTAIGLIDTDFTPTINSNVVSIKLKYPTGDHKGAATIVFVVTLVSGGVYPFFFHGAKVR
ncbi:MAG: hypothetical protein RBT11_14300 [Desulfobacterales bacterium]|jgi:hypothetical protein|nr:hypothetical protein [Desulfobacterales bacterium]